MDRDPLTDQRPLDVDDASTRKRAERMFEHYAGSLSDVDRRDEDADNRWDVFSDEELTELRNGVEERRDKLALPADMRERAGRLATEMSRELRRRRREKDAKPGMSSVRLLLERSEAAGMGAVWATSAEVDELRRAVRSLLAHLECAS